MKKTFIAMLFGFSAMANASILDDFRQADSSFINSQIEQTNSSEVCQMDYTDDEMGSPNKIRVGFNKNTNLVTVVGHIVGKNRPLVVMSYDMDKDTALKFSASIMNVSKRDTSDLDDDGAYQAVLNDGTKRLVIEKYNTNEIMFGVGDDMRLTGGYFVEVSNSESLISNCIETAANNIN